MLLVDVISDEEIERFGRAKDCCNWVLDFVRNFVREIPEMAQVTLRLQRTTVELSQPPSVYEVVAHCPYQGEYGQQHTTQ